MQDLRKIDPQPRRCRIRSSMCHRPRHIKTPRGCDAEYRMACFRPYSVPPVGVATRWGNTIDVTARSGRSWATSLMMPIPRLALLARSTPEDYPPMVLYGLSVVMGVSFPFHPSMKYSFNRSFTCFGQHSHSMQCPPPEQSILLEVPHLCHTPRLQEVLLEAVIALQRFEQPLKLRRSSDA